MYVLILQKANREEKNDSFIGFNSFSRIFLILLIEQKIDNSEYCDVLLTDIQVLQKF